MSNRLKEAEIFASGAPGYWQVFQAPDPRLIVPSSLLIRPAIFGAVFGIFGAGIAIMLALVFTHRTSRRSILECCAATRAPLVSCIPTTFEKDARAAIGHFWITRLAPRINTPAHILFWTPALEPGDERRFWSLLASATWDDTGKIIRILDLTPDSLWNDDARPDSLEWSAYPLPSDTNQQTSSHFAATILRASSLPHGDARELLAQVDYWMAVVAGQRESLRRAAHFRPLTDAYLPPCDGTIGWTERPHGSIRVAADLISRYLAKRFS
jgi:hypothetical protein